MQPPTKKQRKLEHAIDKLTVDGVRPSYGELAAELKVTTGAIRSLVMGLHKRGRIHWIPRAPRSLEPIKEKASARATA